MSDIVTKDSIKNIFKQNITNKILNAKTSSEYPLNFTGVGRAGEYGQLIKFNNPPAIPVNDLASSQVLSNNIQQSLNLIDNEKIITLSYINKIVKELATKLSVVRKFNSKWYRQVQDSLILVNEKSGGAIFNKTLSSLSAFSHRYFHAYHTMRKNPGGNNSHNGWSRDKDSTNLTIPFSNFADNDKIIDKTELVNFCNKIYNEWQNIYNQEIKYVFYSCHQNCHNNCYGSRGRR